jgi:hypothetical protein
LDFLLIEGAVQLGHDRTGSICKFLNEPLLDWVKKLSGVAEYTMNVHEMNFMNLKPLRRNLGKMDVPSRLLYQSSNGWPESLGDGGRKTPRPYSFRYSDAWYGWL